MVSNVEFKSNLYPLKDYFMYDHEFLSQIHDVFALERLKNDFHISNFKMSELQASEYQKASGHCVYAKKDDYVWGTIIDPTSGKERVVCKCTNVKCRNFYNCRKDFNPDELKVIEENKKYQLTISDTPEIKSQPKKIDVKPKVKPVEKVEPVTKIEKPVEDVKATEVIENAVEIEPAPVVKPVEDIQPAEVVKNSESDKAGFENFVEVTQEKIIKSDPNEKIIVNGGPGTGKTWTLIQKIVYMVEEQDIPAENILVFCFSRAAVEVVRSRMVKIAKDDCRNVDIRTFDSFATYLLAFAKNDLPELLPQNYRLEKQNYNERISQAVSILKNKRDILNTYTGGHIIVDEVQDLVGVRAELVIELLKTIPQNCGFTLFGDSCQSLYDYLAETDKAVMSSENFYSNIFQDFPKAKCYSLIANYRQSDNLKNLIDLYREKILEKNYGKCILVLESEIKTNLPTLDIKLKNFTKENANPYLNKGTLGILTRTNGQALQISSWLQSNEIKHKLQRNSKSNFGDWIAKIFYGYENLTISESDFMKRHMQVYPKVSKEIAIKRWNALVNTQIEILPRYEVEDLLKGVLNNAKDNILFESGDSKDEPITVSNIHRAKGKEFDSVILLKDLVEFPENDNNILEHKVCYVGLTRAKKIVNLVEMDTQYNYIIPNENRRCYKANWKNSYLSNIEVGINGDVDIFSLCSEEVQKFIATDLKSGTSVFLKKCPEGTKEYVTYEIIVEEPRYLTLGYTGKTFAIELEQALKRLFDLNNVGVYYKIYPNEFDNVCINEIITCISGANVDLPAAKTFGDMKIWYGFSIVGLAKVVKDRH
jgi:hypothetical protein